MDQRPIAKNPVRFGPFLVNFDSGEVFKSGRRLKVQDQPFRVLAALLERPGEVVTREQLQARIWPDEGFGDFDHALRIAIAKLRGAFGDAPEAPRFIETLPRRGYRFIFPIDQSESVEPTKRLSSAQDASASPPATPNISSPIQASKRTFSPSQWVGVVLVFTVAVAAGLYLFLGRASAQPKVTGTVQITHNSLDITGMITDGFWLYLTESTGSRQILTQVSGSGGERKEISTPFGSIAISDISPDHSELLVTDAIGTENKGQLWILPVPQGPPRRLADVSARWNLWDPGWAIWTPDAQHIVFADDSTIKVVDSNGKNPATLVQTFGTPSNMRYSPDGRYLRFNVRNPHGETHTIWEVRADGRDLHPLFREQPDGASDLAGNWSKDGKYYFFTRCGSNGCHVWFKRESRGFLQRGDTSPVQLTSGPTPVFFTGVRADGKGIFVSEWSSRGHVVGYDSVSRQFLPFLSGLDADELDFSRDGKWMAYVSGPNRAVWRSRIDGTESLQLTSSGSSATPRWSPDGRQIVYVEQSGTYSKIMMIPAEGGAAKAACPENQDQVDPSWSPDGKKLIYARTTWPKSSSETFSLKSMDISSCQVSEIPGSDNLFSPRWSPDGRHIAAISRDTRNLRLLDVKSGTWTNLTHEEGAVIYPAWSADSKYIYFDNISSQNPAYRRIRVGQTTSEAVVDLKSLRRGISSHLGPWSGLTANDQPLFQQDLSTGEVHFLELAK